jgi:hypothetical protein
MVIESLCRIRPLPGHNSKVIRALRVLFIAAASRKVVCMRQDSSKSGVRWNKERGSGAGGIAVFLLTISLLWSAFFWVSDWIYNTKEAKVQAHWEAYLNRNRSGINLIDRGPGEYEVNCRPGFSKECS